MASRWAAQMQDILKKNSTDELGSCESFDRSLRIPKTNLVDISAEQEASWLISAIPEFSVLVEARKASDIVVCLRDLLSRVDSLVYSLQEEKEHSRSLSAAMDQIAADILDEKERSDSLFGTIADINQQLEKTKADFDEQIRKQEVASSVELIAARRAEGRALEAKRRAEEQLVLVETELEEERMALRKLRDNYGELKIEAERLTRLTGSISDANQASQQDWRATEAENTDTNHQIGLRDDQLEVLEQAQILQISTLQAELLQMRKMVREAESREAVLNQKNRVQEQTLAEQHEEVHKTAALLMDFDQLQSEYTDLLNRYKNLVESSSTTEISTIEELKQLRRQVRLLETELAEEKAHTRAIELAKNTPDLEAMLRQEALGETLTGLSTHLAAVQAQYARPSVTNSASPNDHSFSGEVPKSNDDVSGSGVAVGSNEDDTIFRTPNPSIDLLHSRITQLESSIKEKNKKVEKYAADILRQQTVIETLEDNLTNKLTTLDRTEQLNEQYLSTIDALTRSSKALRASAPVRLVVENTKTAAYASDKHSNRSRRSALRTTSGEDASRPGLSPLPRTPQQFVVETSSAQSDATESDDVSVPSKSIMKVVSPTISPKKKSTGARSRPRLELDKDNLNIGGVEKGHRRSNRRSESQSNSESPRVSTTTSRTSNLALHTSSARILTKRKRGRTIS
ncbi:unnamed protein product [Phytomonas sp. Hart1]|nr:unnamed protein product [Phytomonas sp. Hart1]|eukprot:CCW69316.1 unnamed protein product [Phytomonas sp. isolate Hart1]